jgi:hypothetical protein
MLYDLIFLMHIDHWHYIIPVTFHLVCMEACHFLAFRMLALLTFHLVCMEACHFLAFRMLALLTFHLVCMEACHFLAFRMLALLASVFVRFLVSILFRIDLVSGILVSSCKLGIVDVPHAVVLVLFLKTEFRVFFNMLVVLLWLVSNDIVVVALFHENVFLVEVYQ